MGRPGLYVLGHIREDFSNEGRFRLAWFPSGSASVGLLGWPSQELLGQSSQQEHGLLFSPCPSWPARGLGSLSFKRAGSHPKTATEMPLSSVPSHPRVVDHGGQLCILEAGHQDAELGNF